ncbi:hypothetical protein ACPB9E_31400 [Streptomyces exfoliatus]|uniref:hypothetical protein n=1 Tax=Streptomyces exfoliatus TaxID=1905 RepID=UPI003C2F27A3
MGCGFGAEVAGGSEGAGGAPVLALTDGDAVAPGPVEDGPAEDGPAEGGTTEDGAFVPVVALSGVLAARPAPAASKGPCCQIATAITGTASAATAPDTRAFRLRRGGA